MTDRPELAGRLDVPGSAGADGSDPEAWVCAAVALRDRHPALYCEPGTPATPSKEPPGTALKLIELERRVNAWFMDERGKWRRAHKGPALQCFHPAERRDSDAYRLFASKTGGERDGLTRHGAEDEHSAPEPESLLDHPTLKRRLARVREFLARRGG